VSLKEQASFCRAFASVGSFCYGVEIASLLRGRRSWGFASTCHTAVVCSLDSIKLSVEYAEIKPLTLNYSFVVCSRFHGAALKSLHIASIFLLLSIILCFATDQLMWRH
jgi:hypothetical protein